MTPTIKTSLVSCTVVAVLLTLVSFTYQQEEANAKVKSIDGIEIYIQSEPLKKYKVVDDLLPAKFNFHMSSIDNLCSHYVKVAKKKEVEFDALVFQNNWRAYMVKWE